MLLITGLNLYLNLYTKRCILIQVLPVPNAYTNFANACIHYANMHEQVAKSLVYALAGGSTCMSIRLLGM